MAKKIATASEPQPAPFPYGLTEEKVERVLDIHQEVITFQAIRLYTVERDLRASQQRYAELLTACIRSDAIRPDAPISDGLKADIDQARDMMVKAAVTGEGSAEA